MNLKHPHPMVWIEMALCKIGLHAWGEAEERVHGSWGATWTLYIFRCKRDGCHKIHTRMGEVNNQS